VSYNFLEHYGVVGMKWGRRRGNSLGPPVIELGPNEYRDRSNSSSGGGSSSSRSNSSRPNSSSSRGGSSSTGNTRRTTNDNTNNTSGSNGTTSASKKLDVKGTQAGLKEGKKLADAGVKKLEADRQKETKKDLKSEARNMTDEDLRKVINRLSMEEKYVAAMEKEGYGKSKTDLQKTLELVGTAVTYADTALEVYDKIQKIRGR